MRKALFVILLTGISVCKIFAQPKNEVANSKHDSTTANSKFYFPSKLYTDSNAFTEALPKLAEQALSIYKEKKKSIYFDNLKNLYFFSNNFQKLLDAVDSFQAAKGDSTTRIEVKSYAVAKLKEISDHVSFEK